MSNVSLQFISPSTKRHEKSKPGRQKRRTQNRKPSKLVPSFSHGGLIVYDRAKPVEDFASKKARNALAVILRDFVNVLADKERSENFINHVVQLGKQADEDLHALDEEIKEIIQQAGTDDDLDRRASTILHLERFLLKHQRRGLEAFERRAENADLEASQFAHLIEQLGSIDQPSSYGLRQEFLTNLLTNENDVLRMSAVLGLFAFSSTLDRDDVSSLANNEMNIMVKEALRGLLQEIEVESHAVPRQTN